jgi:hypothetical protein
MTRSKLSSKAVLLAGAIGLSTAAFAASQPAAAQTYSEGYACPVGSVQNTTYGCSSPDYANDYGYLPDYDYGYLPYGAYGHDRDGRHEFGHGFAHGMGASVNHGASVTVLRGSPSRGLSGNNFDHGIAGGLGDRGIGFVHAGFGHGMAGGFGHGMGGGFNHGAGFAHAGGFGHGIAGGFHGGFGGGFHGGGFGGGGHR